MKIIYKDDGLFQIHYLDEEALCQFSDVQIISTEGLAVCTSRLVLSSLSSFMSDIFLGLEMSGGIGTESDVVISTEFPIESLNHLINFITKGILPMATSATAEEASIDQSIADVLRAFGIALDKLELEVHCIDAEDLQRQSKRLKKAAPESDSCANKQPKVNWDILNVALESIGGLDSTQPTALEFVTPAGESQQVILQSTSDGKTVIAQMIGENGDNIIIKADGNSALDVADRKKRALDPYTDDDDVDYAPSAKLRRIMRGSTHPNTARPIRARPRGRPRKAVIMEHALKSPRRRPSKPGTAAEDETANETDDVEVPETDKMEEEVIERPGRRTVKRPKRYEGHEEYGGTCSNASNLQASPGLKEEVHEDVKLRRKKTVLAKVKRGKDTKLNWVTCVACGKVCKNNYLFKIHKKNFGPYHDNSCAICSELFLTWEEHIAHLRDRHNGEYKYKCGICTEVFETEERQRIHRHENHTRKNKERTACDKCGKVVIDYQAHQENFHGTEEHPCPSCSRVFGHVSALKRHIKDNHRQFPCEHCGNIMKNFKKYRLHILSVHTPDNLKPYQCHICVPSRGFPTKWNLYEHMNKHTNERPFKCRSCGSGFATTSSRCHHEKSCSSSRTAKVEPFQVAVVELQPQ